MSKTIISVERINEVLDHPDADRLSYVDLDNAFGRMRQAELSHSRMNNARSLNATNTR